MITSNRAQFRIKKVVVNNFRGYEGEFTFSFGEKNGEIPRLILLTGANGYGKTSLIDAIEWGITGKINRLIKYLDNRVDSSDKDNKKNNEGLIINTNAKNRCVNVEIHGIYMDQEIILKRRFEGEVAEREAITGNNSQFSIICDDEIKGEIEKKLSKFNYDNLCSYDKNIDLYNKGRKDIYEIFSSLYNDENNIGNIIQNLDKVKLYLENQQKIIGGEISKLKDNISNYKKMKEKFSNNISDITYPQYKVYENENILCNGNELNMKDIEKQRNTLVNIRNLKVLKELNEIKIEYNKNRLHELLELKGDIFKKLSNINFDFINKEKNELEDIKVYVQKIKNSTDIYLNTEYKDKIVFMSGEDIIYNIKNIESKISCLNEKISIYSDDNKMVKILRYIVDNTSELTHYQQSHEKCPLCGNGETFKESQIGEVARQVLGENDIERQSINYQIKNLKDEAIHEIKKLKECLIETIDKNLYNLNRNLNEKQYIDEINNLLKILNLEYDEDLIINLKSKITNNFINEIESKEKKLISYINSKEYSFLSDMKSELLYENYEKLSLYNRLKVIDSVISRFNINIPNTEIHYRIINKDELDNRIAICNSYIEKLKSNELLNFIEVNEKNKEIKEHQLEIMDKKIENIKKMIKKVKKVRTNDEINQTELIQKPLEYIYRKITRNTNIKKIELIRGKAEGRAELDIVDLSNKKTSFANIMSAGQLSTLSISIFLAKAYLNSENNVKLYLMDEPIQTMDDLNILSFVDLMKYQLAKDNHKSFIDQVIFSTCDENLSRLFKYKFNSFDIPVCEYKFEGNSKFTKI